MVPKLDQSALTVMWPQVPSDVGLRQSSTGQVQHSLKRNLELEVLSDAEDSEMSFSWPCPNHAQH